MFKACGDKKIEARFVAPGFVRVGEFVSWFVAGRIEFTVFIIMLAYMTTLETPYTEELVAS